MKVLNNLSLAAALALIGVSPLWAGNNGKGNQFNGRANAAVRSQGNGQGQVQNLTPVTRQQFTQPANLGKTSGNLGSNSNGNRNQRIGMSGTFDLSNHLPAGTSSNKPNGNLYNPVLNPNGKIPGRDGILQGGKFDKLPTTLPDRVVDHRLPKDPIKLPDLVPSKNPGNKPFPPIQVPGNKPNPLPPVVVDDLFPKPIDPKPPGNNPHPQPPHHPHNPHHPGWNPGHCHPHHCPPVVLDCFRSCYGTAVCVAPAIAAPIVELVPAVGAAPVAPAAIPEALNGDTITLMFANPQGLEAGRAVLLMGEKTVELTIVSWQADSVTVKLPKLLLTQSISATIYVGNAKGEVFLGQELKIIVN